MNILALACWLNMHAEIRRAFEDFCRRNPTVQVSQCIAQIPVLRDRTPEDWLVPLTHAFPLKHPGCREMEMVYFYREIPDILLK